MKLKDLDSILIIGPGLIGGSLGLALRAGGFRGRIFGLAHRRSELSKAIVCGAVHEGATSLRQLRDPVRMTVICTPINVVRSLFASLRDEVAFSKSVLTDVCSVKAAVVDWACRELSDDRRFVGGHPIAGSENSGAEFARADLFRNRVTILTPLKRTEKTAVRLIHEMWEIARSRVVYLTPRRHDEVVARVSHLPRIAAAALMRMNRSRRLLNLAGPGLMDTTRVASGPARMWREILAGNRTSVTRNLEEYIAELRRLKDALRRADDERVERLLEEASRNRHRWMKRLITGYSRAST